MPHYHYLIVGGGMTADAAIRGIREADSYGSIGLVGAETERPYNRPPLSKGLWKGKAIDSIWRGTDATDAALHLGRTVVRLDPPIRRVIDDQGAEYTYDQLLLATGGTPRRLPFGGDHILYFRTLQDYLALRGLTEGGRRFAVIGGGFIGSEIAAALAMNGKEVVLFLAGENIGEGIFPPGLASFVTDYYRQRGVEVLANNKVTGLETDGQRYILRTQNGQMAAVEGVVAGIGIEPNTRLAEAVGLKVDHGILVDESLRTSAPGSMPPAMSPASITPISTSTCASSTKTMPIPWAGRPGGRWPGRRTPITICRFSTPICSTWATRPWASWIRASSS